MERSSSSSDVMSISVPSTNWMFWREPRSSWRELRKCSCLSRLDGCSITLLAAGTILGMAEEEEEEEREYKIAI